MSVLRPGEGCVCIWSKWMMEGGGFAAWGAGGGDG